MARKKVETPAPSPLVRISVLLSELSQEYMKLAQMQQEQEQKEIEAEYLSFTDAGKLIGMSEGYIRARVADGTLNRYPTGVKVSELRAFEQGGRVSVKKADRINIRGGRIV